MLQFFLTFHWLGKISWIPLYGYLTLVPMNFKKKNNIHATSDYALLQSLENIKNMQNHI